MPTIPFQTQINAPPEKVFAYVADLQKHPEWSHIEELKKTSDGAVGVGSTYESRGKNLGMTTTDKIEVTEYQSNQRIGWRSRGGFGMQFNWSFEVQPQGDGTLLIERFEPPSGAIANLIGRFAQKSTVTAIQEGLARIKEKLEESARCLF